MKLYGFGRSRSFRCVWALEEAQLQYEYCPVSFGSSEAGGTQSDDYRDINSQGKVPTLVDGDLVLTESAAIVNYIARKVPEKHLIPDTDPQLSKYDEMCFFILSDLEQGLWSNGKHRFALPEAQRIPQMLETASWEFAKAQKALTKLFTGNGFVLGEQFTMADILLAQTIAWAHRFEFEVSAEFLDYQQRMFSRPACHKALQKVEV